MSYDSRTGAVLFAAQLDRVAAFYSSVLGLSEANRDDDHILLESPGFQLVVHGGAMDPEEKEWRFHGALVCDALDPDGNVIQFREIP
jgi:catechol-2,3-dioxygenase